MKQYFLKIQAMVLTSIFFDMKVANAQNADFSTIARNINSSIAELPGLVAGVSYLLGIVFAVLGIFKLKDHVDNPSQTELKEGAIRLAAGGALFGLPILLEAMQTSFGSTSYMVRTPRVNPVEWNVR